MPLILGLLLGFGSEGLLHASPGFPSKEPGLDATDPRVAAEKLQRRYAVVHTITARFTQIYQAPSVEHVESGRLFMKKPGLMRWEYAEPEKKLFVADARNTYLYTPEDRQVVVSRFSPRELHTTPLQFLLGQGDLLKSFTSTWENEFKPRTAGSLLLRLVPQTPQADYAFVIVECDAQTSDLRRLVIRELTGNTSEFILTDVVTNTTIDSGQFKFKIPKGIEVISVEDKD